MVLLCGASAVSAASDNAVDNLTSDMDDSFLVSNNLNAVGVDESASVAQENDDGLLGQSLSDDNGIIGNFEEDVSLKDSNVNGSTVFYVGTNKTVDGGNGSFENPYENFELVYDNVKNMDEVTINVFGGTYYLGSQLKFNTSNLHIIGINGSVIIKNKFNEQKIQSFGTTLNSANFTMENIMFDASNFTVVSNTRSTFTPFFNTANLGIFNNCTFIDYPSPIGGFLIGSQEFNVIFNACTFIAENSKATLFFNAFDEVTFTIFKYCSFPNFSISMSQIRLFPYS